MPSCRQLCPAVHIQLINCCPTSRCEPADFSAFGIRSEMLFPSVFPRMEKTNDSPAFGISAADVCRFAKITGAACQSQVVLAIGTSP